MRGAFVWCFVGSVLTQAARACARCCRRSVLCGLLVIEYARRGKKLLCAGRMIVIKIFPVGNAVLWMFSAGTSRKVGAGGKWQSEWSVLWSGGRNDETACKLIARGRCHGLRQVLQMLGGKTGRGVGAGGCRWIVLWGRGRHDETACELLERGWRPGE